MTDFKQVLFESFAVNKHAIRVAGIFKRQTGYRLGRFNFVPLNIDEVGKQAITADVFTSDNKETDSIGQIVFISDSTTTNGKLVSVLFDAAPGTTDNVQSVKALKKAIEIAELEIAGEYKTKRFNIGSGDYKRTVFVYGTDPLTKTQVKKVLDRLYDRDSKDDEPLDEAVSQMVVSTSNGSSPATIRLKGSGGTAISRFVTAVNSLRTSLFLQQVQDNGTCAVFTFGKPNRPTIEILMQRRAGGSTGPRAFGVNANGITDGNDELITEPAIALIRVSDRSNVLAYSGSNSRLKSIVRADNSLNSTTIAGVRLTTETVQPITNWLKSIVTESSAMQIARSWSEFVKSQTPQQQ